MPTKRRRSVYVDNIVVRGYIEDEKGYCADGKHVIEKGERIRTVYLGIYFFDFCLKHWKAFKGQVDRF